MSSGVGHQAQSRTPHRSDSKSKEKLQEIIALLVDRQNDAQYNENKKSALRNLGITSDAPFSICDDVTLSKLKLLLDASNSSKVQTVYAEALSCALSGSSYDGFGEDRRRSVFGENKQVLFERSTGQLILKALIDDYWANNLRNDFCDDALRCISSDIYDLIGTVLCDCVI